MDKARRAHGYVLFPDKGYGWRKQANRVRSNVEMIAFLVMHLN